MLKRHADLRVRPSRRFLSVRTAPRHVPAPLHNLLPSRSEHLHRSAPKRPRRITGQHDDVRLLRLRELPRGGRIAEVEVADNATVRLDLDNEPQPDALLRIDEAHGGQSSISSDDYIEGPPELIVEVAHSSAAYDLHDKKRAYRRNAVREYLVWQIEDERVDWFVLEEGEYLSLSADDEGRPASRVFPGLVMDVGPARRGLRRGALRRAGACWHRSPSGLCGDAGPNGRRLTVADRGVRRRARRVRRGFASINEIPPLRADGRRPFGRNDGCAPY